MQDLPHAEGRDHVAAAACAHEHVQRAGVDLLDWRCVACDVSFLPEPALTLAGG